MIPNADNEQDLDRFEAVTAAASCFQDIDPGDFRTAITSLIACVAHPSYSYVYDVERLADFFIAPNASIDAKKAVLAMYMAVLHPNNADIVRHYLKISRIEPPDNFHSAYGFSDDFNPFDSPEVKSRIAQMSSMLVKKQIDMIFSQTKFEDAVKQSRILSEWVFQSISDIVERAMIATFAFRTIMDTLVAYHLGHAFLSFIEASDPPNDPSANNGGRSTSTTPP